MEYGVKVFGVTIHYVDRTVDGGRIIAQRAIPYEGNDIDELFGLIHAVEHELYPETLGCCLFNVCNESMFSRKFMGIDLNVDE